MKRKALSLFIALATVNLLFFSNWLHSSLLVPFMGTIGFAGFIILANVVVQLLRPVENKSIKDKALVFSLIASVFATIAVFRASTLDSIILCLSSLVATTFALYLVIAQSISFNSWIDLLLSPLQIFRGWLEGGVKSLVDTPKVTVISKKFSFPKNQLKYIVLGIIFLVPTLGILLGLLSSADPVFQSQLQGLNNFKLPAWLTTRGLYSLGVVIFVVPFLYAKLTDRGYRKSRIEAELGKMSVTALVVVIPIALILGFFLVIQSHYLFASVSETELHQFGVHTYSEYVRRGFGELVFVSLITFLTAVVSLVIYQNRNSKNQNILRFVNTILLSEIIIFIFSIFRRVYLYQELHGLTRARAYGSGFLILMLILASILILRHYFPKVKWHLYDMVIVSLFILVITTIGVDRIIANNTPPTVNNEIDYVYIARLSPDAIDKWPEAYKHAKFEIENNPLPVSDDQKRRVVYALWTVEALVEHYSNLKSNGIPDFRHFNFAKGDALRKLDTFTTENESILMQQKANELYNKFSFEQMNYIDRSTDTPLLY